MRDSSSAVGVRFAETAEELQIAQPGAQSVKLRKADIATTTPLAISLMPPGFDKALTAGPDDLSAQADVGAEGNNLSSESW